MNKAQLIDRVVEETSVQKKDVAAVVDALFGSNAGHGVIAKAAAAGDKVQLIGFGSFDVAQRAARKGRNPQTNEEVEIPACNVPRFKAGAAFKACVQ